MNQDTYHISSIRRHGYYLFHCSFCVATIWGQLLFECGVYFFGKLWDVNDGWIRCVVRWWWLLDAVSSTHSLSVLLQSMGMTRTTQTVLALVWWPSSEITRTRLHCRVYYPRLLFEGGVYFVQELRIVRLLFEGSIYSKKYGTLKHCVQNSPVFVVPIVPVGKFVDTEKEKKKKNQTDIRQSLYVGIKSYQ